MWGLLLREGEGRRGQGRGGQERGGEGRGAFPLFLFYETTTDRYNGRPIYNNFRL